MKPIAIGVFTLLCGATVAPAWAGPSVDAIESARESFQSSDDLPWYNSEDDALERLDAEPNQEDWKRQSDWTADELRRPRTSLRSGLFESIIRILAWTALSVLVILVIWALVWGLTRVERDAKSGEGEAQEVEVGTNRIEDLPVPVSAKHTDLLAAAKAYYDAGDLGKAIIYAFAHQLVELDKNHLIQLTKGKTNRQYLRELRTHPRFVELLRPTMLAFEDVFFGHHQLTRQRFQSCWEDLDRFHQQLEQVAL